MRLFGGEKKTKKKPAFRILVQRERAPMKRREPALRSPILIAAFEGWNDAAESATYATRYLETLWGGTPLAEIDGEEFYDFTSVRPETTFDENGVRHIVWPSTSLILCTVPDFSHDVVLLRAPEPQIHWRTYCEVLVECAKRFGIERVVMLGAYLSEVTHRQPVAVNVSDRSRNADTSVPSSVSPYEGPTGIVGVLAEALTAAGVENSSIWASVPCYSLPVSQKAALALVETVARDLDVVINTVDLESDAREYETRMNELVEDDENIASYVARIEEMEDEQGEGLSAEGLTEEIERYLRGRRFS